MEGRKWFNAAIGIMVAISVLLPGTEKAVAGPGGGTYYANSPAGGASGTALRKFVDSLPGLGPANKNNLGSYIPLATPITGRPGVPTDGDYYEIGLVEYSQKLHSDLPKKTKLRGYVDLNPAFLNNSSAQSRAQYLGPVIVAKRDRPVRVKFTNLLPTGNGGKLFLPVDTSLMGAGPGPLDSNGNPCSMTTRSPLDPAQTVSENCPTNVPYTQNRATIHLHGGNSPWISDGTPHQWITPAGEVTPYTKGVGVRSVPDMWFDGSGNSVAPGTLGASTDPGPGSMTFFWTNQQSNRFMFYHDHSLGITRLNVYAGEAAGYLVTDPVEEGLIDNGTLPNVCPGGATAACEYRYGVPLIIQDKTFVPQNVDVQDSLWARSSTGTPNNWGGYGDLWFPHVYEPNQDPTSPQGANPFGRWDYGPWFWPPVSITADKLKLPEPSTTPEAFMDTMLVNGTAYPYLSVEPKPYRFRILNACNDRALNLSLFYADPNDPSGKEVKMVPAGPNAAFPAGPFPDVAVWPTDGRAGGVPDPVTMGPKMIQIGNESGFIPYPVVHPNQPINYNYNRRDIVVLNIQEKNLFLGSAERADVIIDFSQVPTGSTLILYNDAPAPVPAGDPRQDYYTGNPDQTANGGAPSTIRGFGPNTRTIMQFRVTGTPAQSAFNLTNLQTALPVAFKATQPAPLVPEPTYPAASGANSPTELYSKIQDYSMTFNPLDRLSYTPSPIPVTIPFQAKAIQELWDPYGRMNATLGVELPFTNQFNQTTIPMGYAEPATERIVDGHPQMWKITHNGVDTHPVHFHMFDVQVVNRVGWDGAIRPPDDNELGWKETVRMNPLEDIIVALRPKAQTLPFVQPISTRSIDPTQPVTAMLPATDIGNLGISPQATPVNGVAVTVPNAVASYGYEYVWHCHILGHEENDFMRPVIFAVSTSQAPKPECVGAVPNPCTVNALNAYIGGQVVPGKANYVASYTNPNMNHVVLQWPDGAPESTPSRFLIQRRANGGAFADIAEISFLSGYPPIYTDTAINPGTTYDYQVIALNDFMNSEPSATATATVAPNAWTAATDVTVAPSKPTPHVVGTNVQFVATGLGATSSDQALAVVYQYRFLLDGTEVQAFSTNNMWTLPDTTPVGTYAVTVEARTSPGQNPVASRTVSYQVINTPIPPATVASPVPGLYAAAPVTVTLTATTNAPPARIFYTLDGNLPTTASMEYTVPIVLNATTTINYFAVDANGTAEPVHSDTWYIHTADMVASVTINNGATVTKSLAVNLNLSATDPTGVATMQFSNDGSIWSAEEPYQTSKSWTLAQGSDGSRKVYVRFRDKALPPPGVQYPPVTATIDLDTTPPTTTPSPVPGTYSNGPLTVSLVTNEPSTIYYTTNGSTPTTGSTVYATPIPINNVQGQTTTIKYFAVDQAGNAEPVQTGAWTMHIGDLTGSIAVNGGASWTRTPTVTLTLTAADPVGVATYELSNDGTVWSAPAPPTPSPDTATTRTTVSWNLTDGEGLKTVYVRFRDASLNGGELYPPFLATILMGQKDGIIPGTSGYLASALRALKIANGMASPGPLDLVHADVAPLADAAVRPDGLINLLDVRNILLRAVGSIPASVF